MNNLMQLQGEANLPTKYGIFRMRAYAQAPDERMPIIMLYHPQTPMDKPVNVRIHSECMTGDLFGSLKCECGEQLHMAMEYIGKNGGILIYLRQEGRGIGIINKLHAYREQERGLNTVEANRVLGLEIDSRRYDCAIAILKDLKIDKINLMTNNPDKVKAFEGSSVQVVSRIPLEIEPGDENMDYLKTKKEFFKHRLDLI
ncbi:MAG: GTP cyclohydrolase II [Saprospiraceae bacterium]|nr:GTP cyclohydrolase II [Saprospiraceae bacterium]